MSYTTLTDAERVEYIKAVDHVFDGIEEYVAQLEDYKSPYLWLSLGMNMLLNDLMCVDFDKDSVLAATGANLDDIDTERTFPAENVGYIYPLPDNAQIKIVKDKILNWINETYDLELEHRLYISQTLIHNFYSGWRDQGVPKKMARAVIWETLSAMLTQIEETR